MAVAQANINRDRRYINGRVLGWTNSAYIEFLDKNLNFSYPLFFNNGGYSGGEKEGVAFNLELPEGYLTFDDNSIVKLVETDSYKRTDVSANSFFRATAADPFEPTLNEVSPIYDRASDTWKTVRLGFYPKPYNNGDYVSEVYTLATPLTQATINDFSNGPSGPKTGTPYLGRKGYGSFGMTFTS